MPRRVVITGTGVISALADSPQGLHNALCQGHNGWGSIEGFDTEEIACRLGGEIKDFSPNTYLGNKNFRPLDRTSQLSASAAQQTLADSGWSEQMREEVEVGLVLGTMFSSVHTIAEFDRRAITLGPRAVKPLDFSNTVINAAAGQTAIWHNLRGINSTVANGIASGLQALCYAADLIRCGQSTALLAGGAEELAFEAIYGFSQAGLLPQKNGPHPIPFDARRNGFIPSEGAAFLMLEEAETARTRGASVLAEIRGYSTAFNGPPKKTDQTAAIKRALQGALTEAKLSPDDIHAISASANGSIREDRLEAEALSEVFGPCRPPITAIKSMLGEALGASGAFQAVALLESMHKGVLPGILGLDQIDVPLKSISPQNKTAAMNHGLINAFGFDGNSCALILSIS